MKTAPVRKPLPTTKIAEPEVDAYEEISSRAYEIYVESGREDGHDVEHWLQAEMEVKARKTRPAAA
ncbi:MAG TPA: DUF2934 domain-containing protein [Terriglobales bacterium]|nr:DUF2934 domain-containing protein [Terriglobales bacterium]